MTVENAVDDFFNQGLNAKAQAFEAFDADPDKAAKSISLGQSLGRDPAVVYRNFDDAERNHRAQSVDELINDPHLNEYINSSPMAAKVSTDDWGNLSKSSESIGNLNREWYRVVAAGAARGIREAGAATLKGTGYLTGSGYLSGLGSKLEAGTEEAIPLGKEEKDTLSAKVGGILGNLTVGIGAAGVGGIPAMGIQMGLAGGEHAREEAIEAGKSGSAGTAFTSGFAVNAILGVLPFHLMMAPTELAASGLVPLLVAKATQAVKSGLVFGAAGEAQKAINALTAYSLYNPNAAYHWDALDTAANLIVGAVLGPLGPMIRTYTNEGKLPPTGLHPEVDKAKENLAKADIDSLDGALKDAQQSTTRERSPEMYEHFVSLKERGVMGISVEAVQKLYGDKEPIAGEGPLGFIPDIQEQFRLATSTGGDIEVPIAKWLAHVEPDVAKEVKDFIRVRQGGVTLEEAKGLGEARAMVESVSEAPVEGQPIEPTVPREVQSVRTQAGVAKPLTAFLPVERRVGDWLEVGQDAYGFVPNQLTKGEQLITSVVDNALDKLLPQGNVTKRPATQIQFQERPALGIFVAYDDRVPLIMYALGHGDPIGIARHEAIHYLREYQFFIEAEWSTLERVAKEEDWLGKDRGEGVIRDNYKDFNMSEEMLLEEAIAEEFRHWKRDPKEYGAVGKIFEKLRALLESLLEKFNELRSKDPEVDAIFSKLDSGEIGSRKLWAGSGTAKAAVVKQGDLDVTRQGDKPVFKTGSAIGITNKEYQQYMQLVRKQSLEDMEYQAKTAEKVEKKRLTREWKENEGRVRGEVETDISQRPDASAINFFRNGMLYGEDTHSRPRINEALLTTEQRAQVPEGYLRRDGMAPGDVAELFGYHSVDEMIASIRDFEQARDEMPMKKFMERMVDEETERQMQRQYGDLNENILEAAKDHVLGTTQMDMLHEGTLLLGQKAGLEITMSKIDFARAAQLEFENYKASRVSSDRFLDLAGKAGRAISKGLLGDKGLEAFKAQQMQYMSMLLANEAVKFEKEQARLERRIGFYNKRDLPKGVAPEYTYFIQDLMTQAQIPLKVHPEEIATGIKYEGYATLDALVQAKNEPHGDLPGMDIAVPEGYRPKPLEQMSVAEFREFKDVIDSMHNAGREEQKVIVAGEKEDRAAFVQSVLDHVEQLPAIPADKNRGGHWLWSLDAPLTRVEEIIKDLDLRNEMGPLFKGLIIPFSQSKDKAFTMLEALSRRLRDVGGFDRKWRKSLDENIPHDFIIDPDHGGNFKLTRWNMIRMMLNWGNEENALKMARGMASAEGKIATIEEAQALMPRIKALFDQHAKAEDWKFVQTIWDQFKVWQPETDNLFRYTSGTQPKWVPARPIETPHGTFEGGYFPLAKDYTRPIGKELDKAAKFSEDELMKPVYRKATTNQTQYKERTGAAYWVDISSPIENVAGMMQQHIHDIAYRDFVINAGKIIYDPKIKAAIRKHYGADYEAQLDPWLKRIANQYSSPERELQGWQKYAQQLRLNLIAYALPLNYTVMLSPSVGTFNPKVMGAFNADRVANKKLVMENSRELQHMLFNIDRDLNVGLSKMVGEGGWTSFQRRAMEGMFKPLLVLEQEFRMATFYGEFMGQKAKGLTDFEASSMADSIVRERHGAFSQGDLPALMASKNEITKWATMFMGFFTSQRNWARQIPGSLRRGDYGDAMKAVWGTVLTAAVFNTLLFTRRKEDEGAFHFFSRAIGQIPFTWFPGINQAWNLYSEGYKSTTPLVSLAESVGAMGRDGYKAITDKQPVKRGIRHTTSAVGAGLGVPGSLQIGRTGQFLYDVNRREQRPRDIIEWMRGIATGEARLRK